MVWDRFFLSQFFLHVWNIYLGLPYIIGLLRGGVPRGGGSLIFPKVPQSSQTESLGFPSYPPLEHPPLRNPTNTFKQNEGTYSSPMDPMGSGDL